MWFENENFNIIFSLKMSSSPIIKSEIRVKKTIPQREMNTDNLISKIFKWERFNYERQLFHHTIY